MNRHPSPQDTDTASHPDVMFGEYAPQGRLYAKAILSNEADADEVVQDAFLKILRAVGDRPLNEYFHRVFFKTIRNLCIDLIRKRSRARWHSLDQLGESVATSNGSAAAALAQTKEQLAAWMSEMSNEWSEALRLRVHESKSYAEIASDMSASVAQVRTWIFRARQFLRDRLALADEC